MGPQTPREIKRNMSMESVTQLYNWVKPYLAVIVFKFGYAGMTIICKFTLAWGKGTIPLAQEVTDEEA
jgi:hypothetical protein